MANKSNNDIAKEAIKLIKGNLDRSLRRGVTMRYVEDLRDRIVNRTRVGIGINPETGRGERLKKLSRKYVNRRKGSKTIQRRANVDIAERRRARAESKKRGYKVKPDLSSKTSPAKSNLTATGQLLDSLTVIKLKLKNAWGFRISVPDNRRGRDVFGQPNKQGLTNRKLAQYVAEQGRAFMGFTKSQRNIIVKEITKFIIRGIK